MKMTNITYSSFEQINHDLQVLRLQREIDKESINMNLQQAKNYFNPTHLLGGMKGFLQNLLLTFAVKKIAEKFG